MPVLTPGINSPSTDSYLAAVAVSPEGSLPFDGIEGTVVVMWYLGLFDAEIDPAWPFSVGDSFGLAEGAQLRIYASSYDERTWLEAGAAAVGATTITSDDGAAIPVLTTLILVAD